MEFSLSLLYGTPASIKASRTERKDLLSIELEMRSIAASNVSKFAEQVQSYGEIPDGVDESSTRNEAAQPRRRC
jgi:hypothetical protein